MNKAYLLIGGNMGDRESFLAAARNEIQKSCGTIIVESSIYQTAAWGLEEQDPFLNQALLLETGFDAHQLLQGILGIEEFLGRKREVKYGPRMIDLDILLFNKEIIKSEGLTIPHPQMQNRRFVLEPLNEIAGHVIHPAFQKTIGQLLAECPDKLAVQKFR
jgi:2-amino-4-hydroxy-6-hydroxymethyldihydropteridine diphosphokinase